MATPSPNIPLTAGILSRTLTQLLDSTDTETRRKSNRWLEQFRNSPDAVRVCFFLLDDMFSDGFQTSSPEMNSGPNHEIGANALFTVQIMAYCFSKSFKIDRLQFLTTPDGTCSPVTVAITKLIRVAEYGMALNLPPLIAGAAVAANHLIIKFENVGEWVNKCLNRLRHHGADFVALQILIELPHVGIPSRNMFLKRSIFQLSGCQHVETNVGAITAHCCVHLRNSFTFDVVTAKILQCLKAWVVVESKSLVPSDTFQEAISHAFTILQRYSSASENDQCQREFCSICEDLIFDVIETHSFSNVSTRIPGGGSERDAQGNLDREVYCRLTAFATLTGVILEAFAPIETREVDSLLHPCRLSKCPSSIFPVVSSLVSAFPDLLLFLIAGHSIDSPINWFRDCVVMAAASNATSKRRGINRANSAQTPLCGNPALIHRNNVSGVSSLPLPQIERIEFLLRHLRPTGVKLLRSLAFVSLCDHTSSSATFDSWKTLLQALRTLDGLGILSPHNLCNAGAIIDELCGRLFFWQLVKKSAYPQDYETYTDGQMGQFVKYREDVREMLRYLLKGSSVRAASFTSGYPIHEFLDDCRRLLEAFKSKAVFSIDSALCFVLTEYSARPWQMVESILHALTAVSKSAIGSECESELERIFDLLFGAGVPPQRGLLCTLVMTISTYSVWIGRSSKSLRAAWQVIMICLQTPQHHPSFPMQSKQDHIAAVAAVKLSDSCNHKLVPYLEQLLETYMSFVGKIITSADNRWRVAKCEAMSIQSTLLISCTIGRILSSTFENDSANDLLDSARAFSKQLILCHFNWLSCAISQVSERVADSSLKVSLVIRSLEAFLATAFSSSKLSDSPPPSSTVLRQLGVSPCVSHTSKATKCFDSEVTGFFASCLLEHRNQLEIDSSMYQDSQIDIKSFSSLWLTFVTFPRLNSTRCGRELFELSLSYTIGLYTRTPQCADFLNPLEAAIKHPTSEHDGDFVERCVGYLAAACRSALQHHLQKSERLAEVISYDRVCDMGLTCAIHLPKISQQNAEDFILIATYVLLSLFETGTRDVPSGALNFLASLNTHLNIETERLGSFMNSALGFEVLTPKSQSQSSESASLPLHLPHSTPLKAAITLSLIRGIYLLPDPCPAADCLWNIMNRRETHTMFSALFAALPRCGALSVCISFERGNRSQQEFKQALKSVRNYQIQKPA